MPTAPTAILLTEEQNLAIKAILAWFTSPDRPPDFRLGGYAGTGKTTLIRSLLQNPGLKKTKIAVVAPTGKASLVLRSKGIHATTIHALCYELISARPMKFELRFIPPDLDLIICDESSMVNQEIFDDLTSFNIPILWIGDPGQLSPVGDDPKIMHNRNVTLSKILRQAEDNPIIQFATQVRENKWIKKPSQGADSRVIIGPKRLLNSGQFKFSSFDQIIVGRNKTRRAINNQFRQKSGKVSKFPTPGEKLICLKNNLELGIVNGQILWVQACLPNYGLVVRPDGEDPKEYEEIKAVRDDIELHYNPEHFTCADDAKPDLWGNKAQLDFGYAITAHKAQGSEFDRVLVLDEAFGDDANRWRYTAITRAKEYLTYLY